MLRVDAPDFRTGVEALVEQQLRTWPMLRDAVAALDDVHYKKLVVKGCEVFAQFNPKRIVSTAAKVDSAAIRQRPCFLCVENLPPEEMGIPFGGEFVALCNPFPVLPRHLVVSSRSHTPQRIEGNLEALLDLAHSLGDNWFTLYNGPRCGASAPDHLHFQACSRDHLPILRDLESWPDCDRVPAGEVESALLRNYRVNALIGRGPSREGVIEWFGDVLRKLAVATSAADEPMINLVAAFAGDRWTLICYPRSRHRPSCYDAEGDAKLTVSPAAIDLSGVLVVPHPDHFARISGRDVEEIYSEVVLTAAQLSALFQ